MRVENCSSSLWRNGSQEKQWHPDPPKFLLVSQRLGKLFSWQGERNRIRDPGWENRFRNSLFALLPLAWVPRRKRRRLLQSSSGCRESPRLPKFFHPEHRGILRPRVHRKRSEERRVGKECRS